jgi:hypothetical protein
MATRVRVINEGPHHIIVGSPASRAFVESGNAITLEVSEGHPIVVTEYESDMNEIGSIVLPEGFKQ